MSSTIPQTSLDPPELAGAPAARRRRRKAAWLITTAIVLIATVVTLAITDPFKSGASSHQDVTGNAYPTSLTTVAVRSLSQQTQVSATLGYAGSYSAINQTQGTYTSLPAVGQVISQGQVLYQVDGKPVVLLYGSTPAYRSLSEGATASDVTGPDVAEQTCSKSIYGTIPTQKRSAG